MDVSFETVDAELVVIMLKRTKLRSQTKRGKTLVKINVARFSFSFNRSILVGATTKDLFLMCK